MKTTYRNAITLTIGSPSTGAQSTSGLAVGVTLEVGKPGRASSGEVAIYNLSDTTRALLSEDGAWVSVGVTRDGVLSELVTRGDIASVRSDISGRDIITTLAIDTGRRGLSSRVSLSYPPGARLRNIVGELASASGIALAYFDPALDRASMGSGWAFMGSIGDALRDAAGSAGAAWRIVGGGLHVTAEASTQGVTARRFAPGTGLIGSPIVGERGDVEVSVELETGIVPGDYFELRSRLLNGSYRAKEVKHDASTIGAGSWVTTIVGGAA